MNTVLIVIINHLYTGDGVSQVIGTIKEIMILLNLGRILRFFTFLQEEESLFFGGSKLYIKEKKKSWAVLKTKPSCV